LFGGVPTAKREPRAPRPIQEPSAKVEVKKKPEPIVEEVKEPIK